MSISDPVVFDRQTDSSNSGVSWGAVIGGAFVSAALSLILLALGAGFGLSAISPWSNAGASATALGTAAIIWLIVMEVVSSAMGGWLTGRLRTRWHSLHTDEVHFRDTANGFMVWAVGLVLTVSFLTTAAVSMAGGAMHAEERHAENHNAYFVDRLFRSEHPGAPIDAQTQAEAARIFASALMRPDAPAADTTYLAQLVAAKAGLNQNEAEKRVTDTINDARQLEDAARRNAARLLFWIFTALLIGAFCASYAATIGGRQRDGLKPVKA
jgi:hypothetical protein